MQHRSMPPAPPTYGTLANASPRPSPIRERTDRSPFACSHRVAGAIAAVPSMPRRHAVAAHVAGYKICCPRAERKAAFCPALLHDAQSAQPARRQFDQAHPGTRPRPARKAAHHPGARSLLHACSHYAAQTDAYRVSLRSICRLSRLQQPRHCRFRGDARRPEVN